MKKVMSVLFLLVMLFAVVMPAAMAEEPVADEVATEAPVGGADAPTNIIVAEHEVTEEVTDEQPLSIGESALYMLKGMVGIFLVTGLIILVLVIMDKAGNRKKETEE